VRKTSTPLIPNVSQGLNIGQSSGLYVSFGASKAGEEILTKQTKICGQFFEACRVHLNHYAIVLLLDCDFERRHSLMLIPLRGFYNAAAPETISMISRVMAA